MRTVRVAEHVMAKAHDRYGDSRSVDGSPDEFDFVAGPLAAARLEFEHFEDLPEALGPAIRSLIVVDPFFGVVAFVAVAFGADVIEIADFDDDPDYWSAVDPPLD